MKLLPALLFAPVVAFVGAHAVSAKVQTQVVEYKQGNVVLQGYLAYDDAIKGTRPGVMIVHEWTGIGNTAG